MTSITEPYVSPSGGSGGGGPAVETIVYNDQYGVPTSITDFNGNTTTFALDPHGNVLQENLPDNLVEKWTYNSAGQPLTYTDANGNTTTYGYDPYGRLTTVTEPLPGSPTVKYAYDAAGDVTSVTDEVGDTTTFTYDPMGRELTAQNPVQAAAGKETVWTYDKDGNVLTASDAIQRRRWAPTALGYLQRSQQGESINPGTPRKRPWHGVCSSGRSRKRKLQ